MEQLSIVKIGGNVIEDPKALSSFLESFAQLPGSKILVHGGGKKATALLPQLGITPKMVNGRRITDAATLDVVLMVYGGLVNKKIVAELQALDCNAIGLSGADANSIQAHKRPVTEIDYGFAGDVDGVNTRNIGHLLAGGMVPVFCALTHDGQGQLLNTNADTIAAELSIGLSTQFETVLYYIFEKKGVLRDIADEDSVITHINSEDYQKLLDQAVIAAGMLPKMHNCYQALQRGTSQVRIGDTSMLAPNSILYTTLSL